MTEVVAVVHRKSCVQCGKDLGVPQTPAEMTGYATKRYCSKRCGYEARRPAREASKRAREERWELALVFGVPPDEVDLLQWMYKVTRYKYGEETAYAEFIRTLEAYRDLRNASPS
jgi:hypothetical protein